MLDILSEPPDRPLESFVRPVHFVSSSIGIETMLSDLRGGAGIMAVVVDEFGGAKGIVMLEDILEVIVGELEDEFDTADTREAWVRKAGVDEFLVGARTDLEHLNREAGIDLERGDYETLAGYLMHMVKAVPRAGAVIESGVYTFTIERGTAQAIEEIRIRKGAEAPQPGA